MSSRSPAALGTRSASIRTCRPGGLPIAVVRCAPTPRSHACEPARRTWRRPIVSVVGESREPLVNRPRGRFGKQGAHSGRRRGTCTQSLVDRALSVRHRGILTGDQRSTIFGVVSWSAPASRCPLALGPRWIPPGSRVCAREDVPEAIKVGGSTHGPTATQPIQNPSGLSTRDYEWSPHANEALCRCHAHRRYGGDPAGRATSGGPWRSPHKRPPGRRR